MKKWMRLFLIFIFIAVMSISPSSAKADDIAVIVNANDSVTTATIQDIRKIYLGEKQFNGSLKVKPIDQKEGSSIRKKFVEKVLSTTEENYKGYWIKKFFKEGMIPPVVKASSQEVIDAVLQENGNYGYIWKEEAKDKAGIKIILTIKAD